MIFSGKWQFQLNKIVTKAAAWWLRRILQWHQSRFPLYLFSFTRWQSSSTEKLNAKAKATASHKDCCVAAIMVITRQKRLVITVNAFFSEKYFFIFSALCDSEGCTKVHKGAA